MKKAIALLSVVAAAALTSCETAGRDEFFKKNRVETYRCAMPPEKGGHFRCGGTYDDIVKARTEPLPDCSALEQNPIQATERAHVLILSFNEFYPSQYLGAALLDHIDFKTTITKPGLDQGRKVYVRVPQGFITDFTSVPKGLPQAFHRTFSRTDMPAIAHDFLYAVGRESCDADPQADRCRGASRQSYNAERSRMRLLADEVIEQGMKDNYSRPISYGTVFLAVRVGGDTPYGRREELRFLDQKSGNEHQLVVPTAEFDGGAGLPARMFRDYVRICPALE